MVTKLGLLFDIELLKGTMLKYGDHRNLILVLISLQGEQGLKNINKEIISGLLSEMVKA